MAEQKLLHSLRQLARTMSAPKGMRVAPFKIGSDAVHIYSDAQRIWLQLRRNVKTKQSIVKPSFKVALTLTPEQAIAIARELLTAAARKVQRQSGGPNKQRPETKTPPTREATRPAAL